MSGSSDENRVRLDAVTGPYADRIETREMRQLAAAILDRSTAWVFAHGDHRLTAAEADRLAGLLARRTDGEPLHYLLGEREFFGRPFRVGPDVLIPRPETEHLVEAVLALDLPAGARVADVGTGSGCIGLTLASERPDWSIVLTDLSDAALEVAEANRARLGNDNVRRVRSDLLSAVEGPFDAVVSNPPYIAADDPHLDRGDLRFEPRVALTDGADGLSLIRSLVAQAFERLAPSGWLWLEHGHDQAKAVRGLFAAAGFESLETRTDLAGIERISGGRRPAG
ncbi:peptide chain release factor N(5)-glutamine methyltransferase [Halomonas denitrificans]|nr:peptide chain release factor N(5)-glutamine methyltransferase [Halomonas denitrificans]